MEPVFYRIVVPTDFSRCAESAWALAQRVAAASGSEMILAHVFTEAPHWSEGKVSMEHTRQLFEAGRQWVKTKLEEWAEPGRAAGRNVRTVIREGAPHQELIALATDERADLIVIGTHGRGGLNRALLGSVADRIVRLAPCPVLTVREPE